MHQVQTGFLWLEVCKSLSLVHTGNKVDCCRSWWQICNKVNVSPIRSTLLPIRSTLWPVLATNQQQLEFDNLSRWTLSPTRLTLLLIRSTLLRMRSTTVSNSTLSLYVTESHHLWCSYIFFFPFCSTHYFCGDCESLTKMTLCICAESHSISLLCERSM